MCSPLTRAPPKTERPPHTTPPFTAPEGSPCVAQLTARRGGMPTESPVGSTTRPQDPRLPRDPQHRGSTSTPSKVCLDALRREPRCDATRGSQARYRSCRPGWTRRLLNLFALHV